MRRTNVGGMLNLEALARLHAPKTSAEITEAVHRLANEGRSDHTIARILQLDVTQVRRMLAEPRTA